MWHYCHDHDSSQSQNYSIKLVYEEWRGFAVVDVLLEGMVGVMVLRGVKMMMKREEGEFDGGILSGITNH